MLMYLFVGAGGAVGSCLRFAITQISQSHYTAFPYGTLISNAIAGLLIGFIIELDQQIGILSIHNRLFLITGVMGGLSTFSAFSIETVDFFKNGNSLLGVLNIFLNLGLSLLCVIVGMSLVKLMLNKVQ